MRSEPHGLRGGLHDNPRFAGFQVTSEPTPRAGRPVKQKTRSPRPRMSCEEHVLPIFRFAEELQKA